MDWWVYPLLHGTTIGIETPAHVANTTWRMPGVLISRCSMPYCNIYKWAAVETSVNSWDHPTFGMSLRFLNFRGFRRCSYTFAPFRATLVWEKHIYMNHGSTYIPTIPTQPLPRRSACLPGWLLLRCGVGLSLRKFTPKKHIKSAIKPLNMKIIFPKLPMFVFRRRDVFGMHMTLPCVQHNLQ